MDDMAYILDDVVDYNPEIKAFTLITQVPTTFGGTEFKEASKF